MYNLININLYCNIYMKNYNETKEHFVQPIDFTNTKQGS